VESWAKAVGDRVEIGELICVVSIEKAAFDFESPYNGTLAEILAPDSVIVPAGAPIGRIDVDEELE
jgi:pyruvate/2-oxoglutarate dehydrogenase complex dihydrolipoamide acyltransferase (E2) component